VQTGPGLGGRRTSRHNHGGEYLLDGIPGHNFLDSVFAILKETGLDPKALELDLAESVLMKRA
jgi:hypothetical protein